MEVKKLLNAFASMRKQQEKKTLAKDAEFEINLSPTPAMLTEVGRQVLADQMHSGEIKFPEGWDDVKSLLFLGLREEHGEYLRRAAIAHLAYLVRCHRTGESLLTDVYNSLGQEIHKNSEDFPQFKPLLDQYQTASAQHNQRRAHVPDAAKTLLTRELRELLGCE